MKNDERIEVVEPDWKSLYFIMACHVISSTTWLKAGNSKYAEADLVEAVRIAERVEHIVELQGNTAFILTKDNPAI